MTVTLGVDTGGTYTDAVLIQDETHVIATAKALTTRQDLAIGIEAAVASVLKISGLDPAEIGLASLSTTLATNALVEGQGGRVALILIGFRERDLETHGLADALRGDPVICLAGGHNHAGSEVCPMDETGLRMFLNDHAGKVSAFAVAGQFAVRNPAHELRCQQVIAEVSDRPVSASHQLSAKLGGPKRAMTALLNARLIGIIDRLITRAETQMTNSGIHAPMMVVRGDGALVSAAQAREKPIETILSGPAASIVGARWLTGADLALVSDIGGTTTDVALLRNGRPAIDPDGAQVGPYRTMVEAVNMRTTGLGGDSEVHVITQGLSGGVVLGPRRVLPVALIARDHPDVVHPALEAQAHSALATENDGRFVRGVAGLSCEGLADRDLALLARIGSDAHPLGDVVRTQLDHSALQRLVARGLVQVAGVTPSDASHALGLAQAWDADAARLALQVMARRRIGTGERLATGPEHMAQMIVDQMTHQTGLALLEAAFAEDKGAFDLPPDQLARHVLTQRGLGGHRDIMRLEAGVNVPVVGLGASAATYYPAVGNVLGTEMILPEHAEVANAIGAVVGRITMRRSGTVTAPSEGRYRVHLTHGPEDFADADQALDRLESELRLQAEQAAADAGAEGLRISAHREIKTAQIEARDVFVEAIIRVEASGRPRVAF